jgi:hypothetical protein
LWIREQTVDYDTTLELEEARARLAWVKECDSEGGAPVFTEDKLAKIELKPGTSGICSASDSLIEANYSRRHLCGYH